MSTITIRHAIKGDAATIWRALVDGTQTPAIALTTDPHTIEYLRQRVTAAGPTGRTSPR